MARYWEGGSIRGVGRALGLPLLTVYGWIKKALWALTLTLRLRQEGGRKEPDRVSAFDEMWTYIGGRHGEKRREAWIWTAVSLGPGGRRRLDFEIGDRSEAPFLRLHGRLPEAGAHYSDSYGVYEAWLPPAQHKRGKGGAANWNEGEHSRFRGLGLPGSWR